MSQNCKSTYTAATTARDANNNTLYSGAAAGYSGRGFPPPSYNNNNNFQQVTAKVLFGNMTAVNDLKLKESAEREARRTL